jgi:hypothetical protein
MCGLSTSTAKGNGDGLRMNEQRGVPKDSSGARRKPEKRLGEYVISFFASTYNKHHGAASA